MRTTKYIAIVSVAAAAIAAAALPALAQVAPPATGAQPLPTTPVCAPIPVETTTPANGTSTSSSAPNGNRESTPAVPEYVIGIDDVLTIKIWQDASMSGDFMVRPDGKISMPLLNEIDAVGLTTMQLCNRVTQAAKQFLESPTVSVVVKGFNSRRVFITGNVGKPGAYPMSGRLDIVQLITLAGGLQEFAKKKEILVIRNENGKTVSFKVNYDDISKGKNLNQIIELKPGDQVIVR
jgi:polysaccharide export outer membrane protein